MQELGERQSALEIIQAQQEREAAHAMWGAIRQTKSGKEGIVRLNESIGFPLDKSCKLRLLFAITSDLNLRK